MSAARRFASVQVWDAGQHTLVYVVKLLAFFSQSVHSIRASLAFAAEFDVRIPANLFHPIVGLLLLKHATWAHCHSVSMFIDSL